MTIQADGSKLWEEIRDMIKGLEEVIQIEDSIVLHGKGEERDERLRIFLNMLQNKGQTLRLEMGEFSATETIWFRCIYDKDGMRENDRRVRHSGVQIIPENMKQNTREG